MKGDASFRLGDYEILQAWEGFSSIRQVSSGEIMHSRTDPSKEARELYVEQSHLAERLRDRAQIDNTLVIWDVGLGAAANAMAAIECYERSDAVRPLQIISFENDLNSLRLALSHPRSFPYLRIEASNALISDGDWRSTSYPGLSWQLYLGDFLERISEAPAPDLIFYDMFSTKAGGPLWTASTFLKIFKKCADRAVELFTYTCSTANRAALLAAGFLVARGRNAGEKNETTIAVTPAAFNSAGKQQRDLLRSDWLGRWERSAAKFPADIAPNERSAFEKIIHQHQQFRNSPGPDRLTSTT
jgi:queuine tRNA-ribosyltransferase